MKSYFCLRAARERYPTSLRVLLGTREEQQSESETVETCLLAVRRGEQHRLPREGERQQPSQGEGSEPARTHPAHDAKLW